MLIVGTLSLLSSAIRTRLEFFLCRLDSLVLLLSASDFSSILFCFKDDFTGILGAGFLSIIELPSLETEFADLDSSSLSFSCILVNLGAFFFF